MRTVLTALALALAAAPPAQAACYADYKAKRDAPLRLHYGVAEMPEEPCTVEAAAAELEARLADGWQLLQVVGVFDETGLAEREASAGAYFLRY